MSRNEAYDVIVVGSGAAGAMATLRAAELGLSVLIVEKAHKYGGTSATSGGVMWIPNHQLEPNDDSPEQTLEYLDSLIRSPVQRDRFFPVPGLTRHSSSPEDANRGETLLAGLKIGAAIEHTEGAWWIPTMHMPMPKTSNFEAIHQAAFDVGRPYSVCVNRNGDRFVYEACSYDEFGAAMVADQLETGANTPCWLVYDATFRSKFTAGGFMPTVLMPDWMIPANYWDRYIFKADTLVALANKIHVPADALRQTVTNMNDYAKTGTDPEFGRGGNAYDCMFGDPGVTPNPCLGSIDKARYYAVPINLGDLGTKGGLKADAFARVVDAKDQPIPNLYAAGNNSGSPFGNLYPGAGGTIGPAMTFAFAAVEHIAAHAGKSISTLESEVKEVA